MIRTLSFALLLTGACSLLAQQSMACTTFCLSSGGQVVVGKSYDFNVGHGLLLQNRRGVRKQALLMTQARAVSWQARYASLTFNQYGRELPLGGMNERGLVVEIMWLSKTQQPPLAPEVETVNELQLIQYLLDTCATLDQALAAARRLQVSRVYAKVHYLICDRQGACGSLEYIKGKRVIHAGSSLPVRVLTNHPYAVAVRHLRRYRGFGGKLPLPHDHSSLSRFVEAAAASQKAAKKPPAELVPTALATLSQVQQGDFTKWQIVYEPGAGRVHFRAPGVKGSAFSTTLDAQSCKVPVQVIDLLGSLGQRPGKKVPYSLELNRRLVQRSFKQLGAPFPAPVLELLARLPQSTRCTLNEPAAP